MNGPACIRRVAHVAPPLLDALSALLIDAVEHGASVGFLQPLSADRARAFWQRVADGVASGERVLFVAEDAEGLCGTGQLVLAQPENQPHRADLSKMLVHTRARRRGVARALLSALDDAARSHGKRVLVLDTADAGAMRLYEGAGWLRVGTVPGYALWPDGTPCDTVYYWRPLSAP
jgi:GNAT superfamily N-acetyltransferase